MATSMAARRGVRVALLMTVSLGGCTMTAGHVESAHQPVTQTPTPTSSPTPTGVPVKGGTLRVLGTGTDYLDPNISDYSLGYSLLRLISRQLYSWPADPSRSTDVVPDLASAMPAVDATHTVYTINVRRGAKWETSPPRQVTAADVVRGVEITCNPAQPSLALTDFESLIKGMEEFCHEFARVHPQVAPIREFVDHVALPGVHVGANRLQVVFELTRPVNYFTDLLTLTALSPRPREMLDELPGGDRGVSHPISDGPYRLASQVPPDYGAPSFLNFDRNPTWESSTDPIRHAYVDRIRVDFRASVYGDVRLARKLEHDTADLCLCGIAPPYLNRLLRHRDSRLSLHPGFANNPYLVFNTVSPNNNGALRNPDVRRAISYALDRGALAAAIGGPRLAPPLTHVLPPGVVGSQQFDPYPHDVAKAKQLLSRAGVTHLVLLDYVHYYASWASQLSATLQKQLAAVGIRLKLRASPDANFDNLLRSPEAARRGDWDVTLAGWLPDWPGNAAASYFLPLFDSRSLPPTSSNYGLYDDPAVDKLIDQAGQADLTTAADLWHQADERVMTDAAIYPIADRSMAMWCGAQVRNCVYVPAFDGADLTSVWRALPHR